VTAPPLDSLSFASPSTLPEALGILAERSRRDDRTVLLAGGTDWYVERHARLPLAGRPLVVDLTRIPALRTISLDGDRLVLGGGTTYGDLRRSPDVASRAPLLAEMAASVGAAQIQARGTLAGNLASGSPAADGVAALAALDAGIVLASRAGERKVPLADFYSGYRRTVLRPDELIARIEMELPAGPSAQAWRKVGTRSAQSISKVALAGLSIVTGGRITRIGLGMASVAPTTAFLPTVRALVLGRQPRELSAAALDEATGRDVSPIDDVRSTAAYRLHVAKALVRNFFEGLGEIG
jgi:CO/xanthine dehydrogenase FAD-binding subunit